jgi:hypothetical protein
VKRRVRRGKGEAEEGVRRRGVRRRRRELGRRSREVRRVVCCYWVQDLGRCVVGITG